MDIRTTDIKLKAQKYTLFLCLFGLFFDTYLDLKRKNLILQSLKGEECPYILDSDDDLEYLRTILKSKQYSLINLGTQYDNEIGSYAPLVMMHTERQVEVQKDNDKATNMIKRAIKKLMHENEQRKREDKKL